MAIEDLDAYAEKYRKALLEALEEKKDERGVSYSEIEDYVGLDRSTLHRYLSGKRDIPWTRLAAICAAIGVSLPEVMREVEKRLG